MPLTPEQQGFMCSADRSNLYFVWRNMKRRQEPQYAERFPTYVGVVVSEEFRHFPDFSAWAIRQCGWNSTGYELDKDLIVKGNRFYSSDTCVFVPHAINSLLTKANRIRGSLPIGVSRLEGRFVAKIHLGVKKKHIGSFGTPGEAFAAYKEAKEAYIKQVAGRYADEIDPRAYAALMAYAVEITD